MWGTVSKLCAGEIGRVFSEGGPGCAHDSRIDAQLVHPGEARDVNHTMDARGAGEAAAASLFRYVPDSLKPS